MWRKLNSQCGKALSFVGREILIKVIAQAILTYPMRIYLLPLSLCDKFGDYSIRTAYKIFMNTILDDEQLRVDGSWSLIWNVQFPPRVKVFLWRACRDCLPVRTRLHTKGVECSSPLTRHTVKESDKAVSNFSFVNCFYVPIYLKQLITNG